MKYKILLVLGLVFNLKVSNAQTLSANDYLNKVIKHHDPKGKWEKFKGDMVVTMSTPNKPDRVTDIYMDNSKGIFILSNIKEGKKITSSVVGEQVTFLMDKVVISDETELNAQKLTKERALFMRNYYTYLYGLPMKLKDKGTQIDPILSTKEFKGKTYNVVKVTYDKSVGKDTWYFYFDPKTLDMEIYQFFHDEAKNDGEYILLSDFIHMKGMRIPAKRAWYTNLDDKLLGIDVLVVK